MRVSLCLGCGNLVGRYTEKCDKCTGTRHEYYKSMGSERLAARRKQLTGHAGPPSLLASSLIILTVAIATSGIFYAYHQGMLPFLPKPAMTAAAPHAVPH